MNSIDPQNHYQMHTYFTRNCLSKQITIPVHSQFACNSRSHSQHNDEPWTLLHPTLFLRLSSKKLYYSNGFLIVSQ